MKKKPKNRPPLPMLKGKRPPSYRAEEVGISLRPQWDLDELIDECNILLQVCTRLRDHRLHNKRCCLNCKFLDKIQSKLTTDGKLIPAGVPDRYICINKKMVKLMENPIEFDFDGDLRTFVCPFMEYSEDSTNIVKYKELKKLLQT